jgi:hypothetical protein
VTITQPGADVILKCCAKGFGEGVVNYQLHGNRMKIVEAVVLTNSLGHNINIA